MHFLDVNEDFAVGALLQLCLEFINLGALASNDDARTRRLDDDAQLVARTLDLDRAHARRLQLVLQLRLQLDVFDQKLGVIAL